MAQVSVEKKSPEKRDSKESQGAEQRQDWAVGNRGDYPRLRGPLEFFGSSPFSPFTLMRRFTDELDRAFSGRWHEFGGGEVTGWSPAIDVSEREGKLIVHADLPGLNKEDVKVEVTDDALTIEGERKREHEEEGKGYRRTERSYGSIYGRIGMPEGANAEEARAQFNKGVLEVSVPIPEAKQKRRQIPVEAGSGERKQVSSESATQRPETSKAAG